MIVVRNKQTGASVKYSVGEIWVPKLIEMNKSLDPQGRYDAIMKADGLFEVAAGKQRRSLANRTHVWLNAGMHENSAVTQHRLQATEHSVY